MTRFHPTPPLRPASIHDPLGTCGLLPSLRFALALIVLLGGSLAAAEEPANAETESAEDTKQAAEKKNVTRLFNGKTLEHWKPVDFGGQGDVEVQDGLLVIEMGQPLTGIVWDGPELPKLGYEISLEAKRTQGSDFFVGLTFPVKESHCSLILGGWGGALTGLSSLNGQDASENFTTNFYSFDTDEWYKVRLRVTDEKILGWVNDELLVDVDHTEYRLSVRLEMDLCRPLGLATFQTEGRYRNFTLRKLTAEESASDSSPEAESK